MGALKSKKNVIFRLHSFVCSVDFHLIFLLANTEVRNQYYTAIVIP